MVGLTKLVSGGCWVIELRVGKGIGREVGVWVGAWVGADACA
jgi:tetrahydromethanopterin S-methyltransferase subunit G